MRGGLFDDGAAGALLDGAPRADGMAGAVLRGGPLEDPLANELVVREAVGDVIVRDGVLVRVVPEDVVPPGEPFEAFAFDEAWFRDAARVRDEPEAAVPGSGSGRPPAGVPVALWPEESLREVLRGVPGVGLARVVADAIDLDDNLGCGPGGSLHGDLVGGLSGSDGIDAAAGAGADSGPGPGAASGPGSGVLDELSDDALGDLVVACGRLQSWAAGVQARVVAERAGRESHALAHNSLVGQVTGELVVTEPEAVEVVVRAESGARHPSVITALLGGRIDVRKAQVLLRSASQLSVDERAEAIDRFLPQAPRRTWKWLQTRMLAFAKTLHGAADTAKAAAQRRCVQVDRGENDMGWFSAYLPAVDAAAVWGVVDDMAHQLRHVTGEDRTLGQLRADSLTGIVTGRLLPADRFTDPDPAAESSPESSTEPSIEVATEAGANAAQGAVSGNAGTSTNAGTSDAASSSADDSMNGGASGGSGGGDTPVCTCGGRAPVQHIVQEVVRPVRVTPTRPVVRVTIPASALLGLDDAPGHLDGYGPIPAETAGVIATDATWQRLLTDPVTGILSDYSTTTYQPGKVLRGAVETRDGTCTFLWGCDTPATRCDLDHIEPFDHDHKNRNGNGNENRSGSGRRDGRREDGRGQTNAHNLHALCRKHHLLKTHAGWNIVRDPDTGITTWTTPTGRIHTRPPTVLDTHIELDQIDPDTSHDLTLHALTGQHLPRPYASTEPGTIPTDTTDDPSGRPGPTNLRGPDRSDEPPF